ncbi:MAG: hypothetical protein ACR2OD_08895 [Gaiellaceae bacterium]
MASEQIEVTAALLNGMADRIDGLNLTDGEQAVMETVLARAAAATEAEVSAFGYGTFPSRSLKPEDVRPGGRKIAAAIGLLEIGVDVD